MRVTATEFKNNIGKYLKLVQTEEVIVTRNGKSVARLCPAAYTADEKMEIARSLFGILPNSGMTMKEIREERLTKKYGRID